MNQDEELAWSSHLAPLFACVGETDGPILELGIGYFSTRLLHAYCGAADRALYSIEKDPVWYEKFKEIYSSPTHFFYPSEDLIPEQTKHWSVVFIDSSPGGEDRARLFKRYIECSDYVVVHDYWRENLEAIGPFLKHCDYIICDRVEPPTLVASFWEKNVVLPQVLEDFVKN
jgi:hypothetical protein